MRPGCKRKFVKFYTDYRFSLVNSGLLRYNNLAYI